MDWQDRIAAQMDRDYPGWVMAFCSTAHADEIIRACEVPGPDALDTARATTPGTRSPISL